MHSPLTRSQVLPPSLLHAHVMLQPTPHVPPGQAEGEEKGEGKKFKFMMIC